MPSLLFLNLSLEKREIVTEAIKKELQKVPVGNMSVEQIALEAGISTATLNQYFDDLDDMISYILSDYYKLIVEEARKSLTNSNGDLFIMFHDFLKSTVEFATSSETNRFYRNLLNDVNVMNKFFIKKLNEQEQKKVLDLLRPYMNLQMLYIDDYSDYIYILEILYSLYRHAIIDIFIHKRNIAIVRKEYDRKLLLLKRGFTKNV